jgi:hypothetical protein
MVTEPVVTVTTSAVPFVPFAAKAAPAAPNDPVFHDRYTDAGLFPGEDQGSVLKKLYLQISTALTGLAVPFL